MHIVIDISDKDYKSITQDYIEYANTTGGRVFKAIKNGTPLPKGHGRIGDLDAVMGDISTSIDEMTNIGIAVEGDYLWAKLNDAIYNAPTIIKADKDGEEV